MAEKYVLDGVPVSRLEAISQIKWMKKGEKVVIEAMGE